MPLFNFCADSSCLLACSTSACERRGVWGSKSGHSIVATNPSFDDFLLVWNKIKKNKILSSIKHKCMVPSSAEMMLSRKKYFVNGESQQWDHCEIDFQNWGWVIQAWTWFVICDKVVSQKWFHQSFLWDPEALISFQLYLDIKLNDQKTLIPFSDAC